ncbi:MAG: hypothetical protein WC655_00435 [Candidatus Hydrogenedentales bacterium]|jgi:hypothetical protein
MLPITIIIALGAVFGLVSCKLVKDIWRAALLGALIATIAWLCGVNLLFLLTAPNELGWPSLLPVLYALGTAFVPSLLVSWLHHQKTVVRAQY